MTLLSFALFLLFFYPLKDMSDIQYLLFFYEVNNYLRERDVLEIETKLWHYNDLISNLHYI